MNDLVLPLAGIGLGVAGGLFLYSQFSGASGSVVAIFGLFRNLFLAVSGLFLIIGGGWVGLLFGVPILSMAIFLGSGHTENLSDGESPRKWLSG